MTAVLLVTTLRTTSMTVVPPVATVMEVVVVPDQEVLAALVRLVPQVVLFVTAVSMSVTCPTMSSGLT